MRRPRDLPKNRRTRRWADSIKLFLGDMNMNIFSLSQLKDGFWDRYALSAAFAAAFQGGGFYYPKKFYERYTGKSKTFKKNKRKGL